MIIIVIIIITIKHQTTKSTFIGQHVFFLIKNSHVLLLAFDSS